MKETAKEIAIVSAYNLETLAQTNGVHDITVNTSKEFYALHDYLVFTLGWIYYGHAHVSQDGNVTINIRVTNNQPEPTNPDNTPSTMNANEIIAILTPTAVRVAAAKLIPAKYFDEYFTPESAPVEYLRDMLEDAAHEHDLTAAEIIAATETHAPEFSELSHAGQCLDIYLHNTREIYERYTVPAIKTVVEAVRRNGWQLPKDEAIKNLTFWTSWQPGTKKALQAAARLVRKYDHLAPTAKDIEDVTRNYAAYIVESATFEIANA